MENCSKTWMSVWNNLAKILNFLLMIRIKENKTRKKNEKGWTIIKGANWIRCTKIKESPNRNGSKLKRVKIKGIQNLRKYTGVAVFLAGFFLLADTVGLIEPLVGEGTDNNDLLKFILGLFMGELSTNETSWSNELLNLLLGRRNE